MIVSTALPDVVTGPTPQDLQFLEDFERCTLPEASWTHLAHVRMAWVCLSLDEADKAIDRIRAGILRYNTEVLDRAAQYHETVTVAFAVIVAARMKPCEAWSDFSIRINDILSADDPVLLRYYSRDRLFSDAARKSFVEPDLEALPEGNSGKNSGGTQNQEK